MVAPAMFSSDSEEWSTPDEEWAALDDEFHFGLDAAASWDNKKCVNCITKEQDCLKQDWAALSSGKAVWFNPPFRRAERACKPNCEKKKCLKPTKKGGLPRGCISKDLPGTDAFVTKAREEGWKVPVVLELPARTDAKWWHQHVWDAARRTWRPNVEVRFYRKRRRYGGAKSGAPFPSVNVIFYPTEHT